MSFVADATSGTMKSIVNQLKKSICENISELFQRNSDKFSDTVVRIIETKLTSEPVEAMFNAKIQGIIHDSFDKITHDFMVKKETDPIIERKFNEKLEEVVLAKINGSNPIPVPAIQGGYIPTERSQRPSRTQRPRQTIKRSSGGYIPTSLPNPRRPHTRTRRSGSRKIVFKRNLENQLYSV